MQPDNGVDDNDESNGGMGDGECGRILLVDDGETNRMIANAMVRRAGFTVDEAGNGAEAVGLAQQHTYVAILMDLAMPVMDGVEATRAIRQFPAPKCDVPVVALTAHDTSKDKARCLEAGMDDYISKPLRYAELLEVLRRTLAGVDARAPKLDKQDQSPPTDEVVWIDGVGHATVVRGETLAQLQEDAGGEAMQNLILMYCGEANRLISALKDKDRHLTERVRLAHSLKSTSATFGAQAIEMTATALEKSIAEEESERVDSLLLQLTDLAQKTFRIYANRGLNVDA